MNPQRPESLHLAREAHYAQFLGPAARRYGGDDDCTILIYAPCERRAFWTYVSSGLSNLPAGKEADQAGNLGALELIAYAREIHAWVPGLMLGAIAALNARGNPLAQRYTMLFEAGFPPVPRGPFFNSLYFTRPLADRDNMPGLVVDRKRVEFRGVMPLHGRERHFAMEHSVTELDRLLAAGGAGYLLDVPRPPVV